MSDIVKLYYPNEWKKNTTEFNLVDEKENKFSWFLCSNRIFDEESNLYYSSISTNVQFFCPNSGKTLIARGLSKKGQKYPKSEIIRARLLILSDPHNKKILCKKYGYLCGCDSKKEILSTECDLVKNKAYLMKGLEKAEKLGFDGVTIQHDSDVKSNFMNFIICQNATFVFKKGILKEVGEKSPQRCGIVKFSKRYNSQLKQISGNNFPSCEEIDDLLSKNKCSIVSKFLYDILLKI